MTKSLNQAFIRAYSKEKASRPIPQPSPVVEPIVEHITGQLSEQIVDAGLIDFVVRFDTATCSIPAPHSPTLNRLSDKPREAVAVTSGVSRPPERPSARASAVSPVAAQALPGPQDEAELRNAIAEQMTRAGEWDGSTAAAFQGGFPMLSQHRQHPAIVRTIPLQSQAIPVHASPLQTPASQTTQPISTEQVPRYDDRTSQIPSSNIASNGNPSVSNPRVSNVTPGRSFLYTSSGSPACPEPLKPDNGAHESALEASLRSPESPKREIQTPSLQSPALLSPQTKPGDFFRLDRPSYRPVPAVQTGDEFSDSGESSSEILELPDSQINLEPSPLTISSEPVSRAETKVRQDAAHAAKIERVQLVERELRRSKLRIFNPVWEVDSFQWPDICLELLEQRAEVLETVAKNLNEAVQEGLQVLAITSPQGGEGRTTVACCLAKLVGSRGLNVAIVDGDIDNPTLSYQTNLDIQQDWKSAILNQLPLEEIAVHSIDDQVTLVPLIGSIDDSELSVDDNRIEFMLHELSESFDLVIVDMGHMNSPRSLVGSLCARGVISAVVAVVDHRTSNAQEIDQCLRRIRQSGVASIGVVENFAA